MGHQSATVRRRRSRKVRAASTVADAPVQSAEAVSPVKQAVAAVPILSAADAKALFDRIPHQWLALAERRLDYYTELYRNGRWRNYYTEEYFVVLMRDVVQAAGAWRELANRALPDGGGKSELRLPA
jgi:hypothetical protein